MAKPLGEDVHLRAPTWGSLTSIMWAALETRQGSRNIPSGLALTRRTCTAQSPKYRWRTCCTTFAAITAHIGLRLNPPKPPCMLAVANQSSQQHQPLTSTTDLTASWSATDCAAILGAHSEHIPPGSPEHQLPLAMLFLQLLA